MNRNLSIPYLMECVGVLKKLSSQRNPAIICAGGAIRDLICGKPVKDLDFFIEGDPWDHEDLEDEVGRLFGTQRTHRDVKSDAGVSGMPQVRCVTKMSKSEYGSEEGGIMVYEISPGFRCYPVQLIFHSEDDVRVEAEHGFDFGICRAWCDERRLRLTGAFHEDRDNQRLTLYHSGHPSRQTKQDRIDRLREKFAGWKFRDLRKRAPPANWFSNPIYAEIQVERLPELV